MDYVRYVTNRRPGSRPLAAIARTLDAAWRRVGRHAPTIVVGAALAERYRNTPRLLDVTVSLVREAQVAAPLMGIRGTNEHRDFVEAVAKRDAAKAEAIMRMHLERTARRVARSQSAKARAAKA